MSVHVQDVESDPLARSGWPSLAKKEPRLFENAGFDQAVDFLLEEIGYRRNPYFAALREKRFARQDFVETQIAFCHQVAMFNRAMMLAATHVALPERRWPAVSNVVDEHHGGDVAHAHHYTIREFVRRVSGDPDIDIDARAMWPEVSQNVATMLGSSLLGGNYGLSGLAMIERMFADISAWIAEGVVSNGWLSEEQLIHYNVHSRLDMRHANELFDVLREDWERGPETRYYVYQGMWVGGWSFNALYTGLWEARERRQLRDVRVAHTPW
jgi:hypothetical protein